MDFLKEFTYALMMIFMKNQKLIFWHIFSWLKTILYSEDFELS